MSQEILSIAAYDYPLPYERIAKYPVNPRDTSQLLTCLSGNIRKQKFTDISAVLPDNSLLVFNNTKVIPARLHFQKTTGAHIEIFLLNPVSPTTVISEVMESTEPVTWHCMIGNKKKWKGEELIQTLSIDGFSTQIKAILADADQNHVKLSWDNKTLSFAELVKNLGEIPLPPYLNRATEISDTETYQTIYAEPEGAVAAPTAGLHFTPSVMADINAKGHESAYITLHVGAGTFQPVKAENALEHHMHKEQVVFELTFIEKLVNHIGPVIPTGTTAMRSLESLYWFGVLLSEKPETTSFFIDQNFAFSFIDQKLPTKKAALLTLLNFLKSNQQTRLIGETEIFIRPGYEFKICDGIITNFHQPKSTLLLLISALIGEKWREVYSYALENDFRFLSYGDASFLMP